MHGYPVSLLEHTREPEAAHACHCRQIAKGHVAFHVVVQIIANVMDDSWISTGANSPRPPRVPDGKKAQALMEQFVSGK